MLPPHLPQETQLYWELLDELKRSGKVARATIVRTWGSTPREVGAKMLVSPSGSIRGTVGGGCGEAEVWQEARRVLGDGQSKLVHVDLTEDTESDSGKVCGGRFDVFIELWQEHEACARSLELALAQPQEMVLATYLGPFRRPAWKKGEDPDPLPQPLPNCQPGSHILVNCALPEQPGVSSLLLEAARQTARANRSNIFTVDFPQGPQVFFLDALGCPSDLVIAGAGHIARPLCEIAAICGFRVVIVDDRADYADATHFPRATQVVCQDFKQAFQSYPWTRRSHVVLVTRGHKHDEECLRQILGRDLAYIGMIGSQRRTQAVLGELREEGIDAAWLNRIFAPIGLDIGAETPEEIAICILAEIIKVRRGGKAASLKR